MKRSYKKRTDDDDDDWKPPSVPRTTSGGIQPTPSAKMATTDYTKKTFPELIADTVAKAPSSAAGSHALKQDDMLAEKHRVSSHAGYCGVKQGAEAMGPPSPASVKSTRSRDSSFVDDGCPPLQLPKHGAIAKNHHKSDAFSHEDHRLYESVTGSGSPHGNVDPKGDTLVGGYSSMVASRAQGAVTMEVENYKQNHPRNAKNGPDAGGTKRRDLAAPSADADAFRPGAYPVDGIDQQSPNSNRVSERLSISDRQQARHPSMPLLKAEIVEPGADVEAQARERFEEMLQDTPLAEATEVPNMRKRRIICFGVLPAFVIAVAAAVVLGIVLSRDTGSEPQSTQQPPPPEQPPLKCTFCSDGTIPPNLETNMIEEETCSNFNTSQASLNASDLECLQGQALAWFYCECPTLPAKRQDPSCSLCQENGTLPVGSTCAQYDQFVGHAGASSDAACDSAVTGLPMSCDCVDPTMLEEIRNTVRSISGDTVDDPSSPQYEAVNWLAVDDPAQLSINTTSVEEIQVRYLAALLYFALNGPSWPRQHNFLSKDHACMWNSDEEGIICNEMDKITSLSLRNNGLTGKIPEEIRILTSLETIELTNNDLAGTQTETLSELPSLRWLDARNCSLQGPLSAMLFSLPQMRTIVLDFNDLTGQLPASIVAANKLSTLWLRSNKMDGTIPAALGQSTDLLSLDLSGNEFTGVIPIFSPSSPLQKLFLGFNLMPGNIPSSIGALRELRLLSLPEMGLTGTLPDFSKNQGRLEIVELWRNRLQGNLDTFLTSLPSQSMLQIEVEENLLTGTIPTSIGLFAKLKELRFNKNLLRGTIPTEIGLLTGITTVFLLHDNRLTGTIPTEMGKMTNLQNSSSFGNNLLTGTIPTEVGSLVDSKYIGFEYNRLTGEIPTDMGRCRKLLGVWTNKNQLGGNIEPLINALPRTLSTFQGTSNALSGSIPTTISEFSALTYFQFFSNKLVGTVPSEIGRLTNLRGLNLGNNTLSGIIPTELGRCTALEALDLEENRISGTVPTELAALHSLVQLFLHGNNLGGNVDLICARGRPFVWFVLNDCESNDTISCGCCTHCCVDSYVAMCQEV